MRHLKRYFLPILAVTVILSASFASPASAVDMSPNVHPIWTNATSDCSFNVYQNGNTYTQEVYNGTAAFWSIKDIYCTFPAGVASYKTYAVISFMVENINVNDSVDAGFRSVKSQVTSNTGSKYGVIGVNFSNVGNSSFRVDVYLYGEGTGNINNATIVRLYNPHNANELFYIQSKERITVSGYSFWQVDTTDFEYDYTNVLNQINSKLGTTNTSISNVRDAINSTNSKIDTTNNKLDTLNNGVSDLKSTQEQANQDANDRYQDEKDTISDNASDAQDTANNADFSFTVGNPLTTWLGLFTGSNCVNIPTIASWIHSNETSVCSPWTSSVRDVTTPIISVLSGTILFGFIVRWLNGSSFNESIEVS